MTENQRSPLPSAAAPAGPSQWSAAHQSDTVMRRMRRTPAFVAGLVMTVTVVLAAVFAPLLSGSNPRQQNLSGGLLPPFSPGHLLGTDQLGRDILSRLLFAARTDLAVAGIAVITPFVVGVLVGTLAGYCRGWVDWIISRIVETVVAFPFYVIVIAVVFAVGAGERGIYVALALVGWVTYARVLRGTTGALRNSEWVIAARGGGLSHPRIVLRHILPNTITQAVVLLMSDMIFVIVAVVTLSYLGLGISPPVPDWGTMINDGQAFVATKWWICAIPGAAVVFTGIGLSLLGDGISDVWRVK
ncbi:ABC transporter permease [Nakamurella antarctica]|uniref:ABC transporter permease n=1 Tax=Nakamurella antarctica TaxID=1902245 RepID=A0A3G8ZL83_9ACTN|nr:ABC transporter permease [Nakamurella antarctica]AZI57537.1 ABC transporter permease [Nakamurella antarctica]